jgi:aspartokinase/homoserine dehydrogenase 1
MSRTSLRFGSREVERARTLAARRPWPQVRVCVAGASGRVGAELVRQLMAQQRPIAAATGIEVVLGAVGNRRGFLAAEAGVMVPASGEGARRLLTLDALLDWLDERGAAPALLVDCTGAPALASRYGELLARGIGVVTASKLAPAGPLAEHRRLLRLAAERRLPYRFETTVGAALPVLHALEGLRLAGDRLRSIAAVLSGSLSFVCAQLMAGATFSAAVRGAAARGFTEPQPADDLVAEDVARKLVILLRQAGVPIERAEVHVEPLLPVALLASGETQSVAAFLSSLEALDTSWGWRATTAAAAGEVLVPLARFDGTARFAVEAVPARSPFARLRPGENLVLVETDRYRDPPLSIGGPGAGPAVTAAGVLADVVVAARQLAGSVGRTTALEIATTLPPPAARHPLW